MPATYVDLEVSVIVPFNFLSADFRTELSLHILENTSGLADLW